MCATVVLSVHHKHVRHCGPERPPLTYVPRHPAHGPRHVHHAPLHTAFDVLMGTPAVGEGKHGAAYRLVRELEFDCPVRSGRRSLTCAWLMNAEHVRGYARMCLDQQHSLCVDYPWASNMGY